MDIFFQLSDYKYTASNMFFTNFQVLPVCNI